MSAEIIPFNPLDKKNLGASVAEALIASKAHPMAAIPELFGAGIYAIYYDGPFEAYAKLAEHNSGGACRVPIYVGKAVPAGARKGGGSGKAAAGRPLYSRLLEHAESIRSTSNLDIADFRCRHLVVDDIWIPLGESLVIARYSPIWNVFIDGFGNHDPGKGRYNGMRPKWDLLHPGRVWADKCRVRPETAEDVAREITSWLAATTFPTSDRFIFGGD